MSGKATINVVDQLFRDITGVKDIPFGGKLVIFGGDFRQTLCVAKRQGRAGIIQNTIIKLPWWSEVKHLHLIDNMRVINQGNTIEAQQFAQFLLDIGNGTIPHTGDGVIRIPDQYVFTGGDEKEFIKWCYPDIANIDGPDVGAKAILTPKNKDVDYLNNMAIDMMLGEAFLAYSTDSIDNDDSGNASTLYPSEFINSIDNASLPPPHKLQLKVGAPLLLIRNINPSMGLCNGTRLQLLSYSSRLLKVKILNGSHEGQETYLPRIDLLSDDEALPFV